MRDKLPVLCDFENYNNFCLRVSPDFLSAGMAVALSE